jgi:hypothetical protein
MFIPHRKHTNGPPLPVTRIVFPFYMWMMFYLTGNTSMALHGLLREALYFFYF